ncbi:Uncharacterised protein [Flavonifractor plautii]|uniref:Uncharacterized protein n=1 Tax=Flavonifractor plautii TaxID=292800 RepID=A0A174H9W7_FLAPL|nr:Uncharacterised protein [Flavonifractor plautii]
MREQSAHKHLPFYGRPRYCEYRGRFLLLSVDCCAILSTGAAQRQAVSHTSRKGVRPMRITLHIGRFTVTIIVKSRNRHSAK